MTRPIMKGDWVCSIYKQMGRDIDNAFLVVDIVPCLSYEGKLSYPVLHLQPLRGGGIRAAEASNFMTVKTFEERTAERLME